VRLLSVVDTAFGALVLPSKSGDAVTRLALSRYCKLTRRVIVEPVTEEATGCPWSIGSPWSSSATKALSKDGLKIGYDRLRDAVGDQFAPTMGRAPSRP